MKKVHTKVWIPLFILLILCGCGKTRERDKRMAEWSGVPLQIEDFYVYEKGIAVYELESGPAHLEKTQTTRRGLKIGDSIDMLEILYPTANVYGSIERGTKKYPTLYDCLDDHSTDTQYWISYIMTLSGGEIVPDEEFEEMKEKYDFWRYYWLELEIREDRIFEISIRSILIDSKQPIIPGPPIINEDGTVY